MKKGFTLIELLGILALLGIIIVVAMPALIDSNKKANNNKIKDACDIIETACDSYRVINDNAESVTVKRLKDEKFLKEVPDGINENDIITINEDGCTLPDVCNN